jgi:hypothetical protein
MTHPAVLERLKQLQAVPEEADLFLEPWLKRFKAIKDRSLRRIVLLELLDSLDDGSLLGLLLRLDTRARLGDAACRWMTTELALTPAVLMELPYERLIELYGAARDSGILELSERFLGGVAGLEQSREGNPYLELSAGERTAKARHGDRFTVDRLLHDRDVRVIAALLENPLLLERDVVRVAAMRPTNQAILETIAGHRRWGQCYRVRVALAGNPYTPPVLAAQVQKTLLTQDVRKILASR